MEGIADRALRNRQHKINIGRTSEPDKIFPDSPTPKSEILQIRKPKATKPVPKQIDDLILSSKQHTQVGKTDHRLLPTKTKTVSDTNLISPGGVVFCHRQPCYSRSPIFVCCFSPITPHRLDDGDVLLLQFSIPNTKRRYRSSITTHRITDPILPNHRQLPRKFDVKLKRKPKADQCKPRPPSKTITEDRPRNHRPLTSLHTESSHTESPTRYSPITGNLLGSST